MSEDVPHVTPGDWPTLRPSVWASSVLTLTEFVDEHSTLGAPLLPAGGQMLHGLGVIGLADDEGIRLNGGRVGARQGPSALRQALARYGSVESPVLPGGRPLVVDVGDIIPGGNLDETHARVTEATAAVLRMGLMPVGIGGGHDLTFPLVRAVADEWDEPLVGVYFDAHLDVRETPGSGMPFRKLVEECGIASLRCIGLDRFANTRAHLEWFEAHGGSLESFYPDQWPTGEPTFVSIDLDVLDSAHAPGVSAVNPAGLTSGMVATYAYWAGFSASVCCFDIMELSPPFDEGERTARVAAHLLLKFVQGCADRMERNRT